MKTIVIKTSAISKLNRKEKEFLEKDFEDIPSGALPGEWAKFLDKQNSKYYLGYINLYSKHPFKIKMLGEIKYETEKDSKHLVWKNIEYYLNEALLNRQYFKNLNDGARLFYGASDKIVGLIVDQYQDIILIQINTAGLDIYREQIKKFYIDNFKNQKVLLFDNLEYRKNEELPLYENDKLPERILIKENEICYEVSEKHMQKIGYYYDHRENRRKLLKTIKETNVDLSSGVDLFSYVGSWGMHLLTAGIKHVDFVDQANMQEAIEKNLNLNKFEGKGTFFRDDVFKFIDTSVSNNKRYNVVVSDPPAFAKSEKNKNAAIGGYEKLHTKAMRLVANNGLFAVASCTHYVSIEELDKTVFEAALKNNFEIQLIDIGIQGPDHPIKNLSDRSSYIKYLLYKVKRGNL